MAKNNKKCNRVAIAIITNENDRLLMGKRNDNQMMSVPGGHLEWGEDPHEGVIREVKEETGLDATSVKLWTVSYAETENGRKLIYVFKVDVDQSQKVDTSNDPDKECPTFEYVDPFDHIENLHVPAERNLAFKYWAKECGDN